MQTSRVASGLEQAYAADERFLWGLCYRMTGSAADADDLVQETFARAIARPPRRTDRPWRPWLVRVALNLARDLLRRRRLRAYVGPWLPAPIETGDDASPPAVEPTIASDGSTTEGRYELLESVSFAFLLALEALKPKQRAVLLLRDVFDYSVAETADALEMTAASVKTTHHRARAAMHDYDRARCIPTRALQERHRCVLERFLIGLASQDRAMVETLLGEGVRALGDGAGEFHAARKPVVGRAKVALFYSNLVARGGSGASAELRMLNGLPAFVVTLTDVRPGYPAGFVLRCDLDADGRMRAVHSILATAKLTAVRFSPAAGA